MRQVEQTIHQAMRTALAPFVGLARADAIPQVREAVLSILSEWIDLAEPPDRQTLAELTLVTFGFHKSQLQPHATEPLPNPRSLADRVSMGALVCLVDTELRDATFRHLESLTSFDGPLGFLALERLRREGFIQDWAWEWASLCRGHAVVVPVPPVSE